MDAEILTEVEQSFRRRCRRSPMVSGAGRLELAVWEWRASVAGRGGAVKTGGLRADGGWREQRTSDDSEPSAWWTFEVGTDLDGAGRRAEDEVVALAGQAAKVDPRLEFRVWGRVRCWWRPDSEPTALWEQGIALTLRAGEESRQWLVDDPAAAPSPGDLAAAEEEMRAGPPAAGRRPGSGWTTGPVVLEPGAAGWWVHEMAHAAMESPPLGAAHRGGLRIVDDPTAAPWPAGFDIDDRGWAARRSVLWDDRGSNSDAGPGRWRSASVRQAPRPALSCSRLEWDPDAVQEVWPAANAVRVRSIDAGRFDPLSGKILLVGKSVTGDEMLLSCTPEQAWTGVRIAAGGAGLRQQMAVCSRQGLMHPVMVGAPTLVLEPLRHCLRNQG